MSIARNTKEEKCSSRRLKKAILAKKYECREEHSCVRNKIALVDTFTPFLDIMWLIYALEHKLTLRYGESLGGNNIFRTNVCILDNS